MSRQAIPMAPTNTMKRPAPCQATVPGRKSPPSPASSRDPGMLTDTKSMPIAFHEFNVPADLALRRHPRSRDHKTRYSRMTAAISATTGLTGKRNKIPLATNSLSSREPIKHAAKTITRSRSPNTTGAARMHKTARIRIARTRCMSVSSCLAFADRPWGRNAPTAMSVTDYLPARRASIRARARSVEAPLEEIFSSLDSRSSGLKPVSNVPKASVRESSASPIVCFASL